MCSQFVHLYLYSSPLEALFRCSSFYIWWCLQAWMPVAQPSWLSSYALRIGPSLALCCLHLKIWHFGMSLISFTQLHQGYEVVLCLPHSETLLQAWPFPYLKTENWRCVWGCLNVSVVLDFIPRQKAIIIESSNIKKKQKHLLFPRSSCLETSSCHLPAVQARAGNATFTCFFTLTCKMGLPIRYII